MENEMIMREFDSLSIAWRDHAVQLRKLLDGCVLDGAGLQESIDQASEIADQLEVLDDLDGESMLGETRLAQARSLLRLHRELLQRLFAVQRLAGHAHDANYLQPVERSRP